MARRHVIAATAVLVFAAAAIYESGKLPLGTLRNPGPGFLPWWAGLTLGFLALLLLVQALISRARDGSGEERGRILKVVGLLVVLGAYVLLLEPLGYPLCTFLLVLFMLRVVDPYRWATALSVAAIAALGTYVVFALWLKVPLPPGPLTP